MLRSVRGVPLCVWVGGREGGGGAREGGSEGGRLCLRVCVVCGGVRFSLSTHRRSHVGEGALKRNSGPERVYP